MPLTLPRRFTKALAATLLLIPLLLTACQKKGPEEMIADARQAFQRGDLIGAIIQCQEILEQHPEAPVATEARIMLGRGHMANGETDQAREVFRQIVERQGLDSQVGQMAQTDILGTYIAEKDYDQAIEEIRALREKLDPDNEFSRAMRFAEGQILYESGQKEAGEDYLRDMIEQTDNEEWAMQYTSGLVSMLARDQATTRVLNLYTDFIQRFPDSIHRTDLMVSKGLLQTQLADAIEDPEAREAAQAQAQATLAQAAERLQTEIEAEAAPNRKVQRSLELAKVLYQMGDTESALARLRALLEKHPESQQLPLIHIHLAEIYYLEDRFEESIAEYAKVMELAPGTPIAQQAQRNIQLVENKRNEAAQAGNLPVGQVAPQAPLPQEQAPGIQDPPAAPMPLPDAPQPPAE